MTMLTSTPTISKAALQALTELTGEPRLNVALLITLKDAIEHRLEKIDAAIEGLEQKYEMSFEQFQMQAKEGNIANQFSYEVESDFLEWDGLLSRKNKLEKIDQWLG
jgi:hypothetical protein